MASLLCGSYPAVSVHCLLACGSAVWPLLLVLSEASEANALHFCWLSRGTRHEPPYPFSPF